MLIFERFRAFNAGPYKAIDLNLRKQGLVRMRGQNGSGKSTAWHLFTQAAYSTTPNKASKTELMLEEKDFLLETTFQQNSNHYVIAQAVKSKELSPAGLPYGTGVYLFRDNQDISMHRDDDTKKLIKKTIGWSLEEWYGYVYLAQQTTHTLINGTRSERQTYLSALFNLAPLDTLSLHFKEKAEALSEQILVLEKEKQEYSVKVSLLAGRNITELQNQSKELNDSLEALQKKLVSLQVLQNNFQRAQELTRKLENFSSQTLALEDLQLLLNSLLKEQATFESNNNLKKSLQAELISLEIVTQPIKPEDYETVMESPDIDELKTIQSLNTLTKLKNTLSPIPEVSIPEDFEALLATPDIDSKEVLEKIRLIEVRTPAPTTPRIKPETIQSQQAMVSDIKTEIGIQKSQIKTLEFKGAECTTCGTLLDCQDREAKLSEKKAELGELETSLQVLTAKLTNSLKVDEEWRKYDSQGPDLSSDIPRLKQSLETYKKKISYLELKRKHEAYQQYGKDLETTQEIPKLESSLALFKKKKQYKQIVEQEAKWIKYQETKLRIESSLIKIPETKDLSSEIQEAQTSVNTATSKQKYSEELTGLGVVSDQSAKVQNLNQEVSSLTEQKGTLSREVIEIENLNKSIQTLQASIVEKEALYREQKKNSLLAKAFGKAGQLRELQLARFSRYLEEALLAHTLRQLPKHRFQINVDDGIDILTSKDEGRPYDVRLMSGGEKGALSVAFLFALDDLLPPDRRTNLKIIDEVEANFDSERQQDFVQFTLPELRKRAETVVVISHSAAINQGAFDRVWEIENGQIVDKTSEEREFEETDENLMGEESIPSVKEISKVNRRAVKKKLSGGVQAEISI